MARDHPLSLRQGAAVTGGFVGVDWGTSGFRLWVMGWDGAIQGESHGSDGMARCVDSGFAPVLARHLAQAGAGDDMPVLICGMAGSRQGWAEAPYADLPAPVDALARHALRLPSQLTRDLGPDRDIRILPGLARRDPAHPDVMRGEETQLLGLAGQGHRGLVCMPGTHCKWAVLQDGAVTSFHSTMTGELFELLSRHSILRHTLPDDAAAVDPTSPAFLSALDRALSDPAQAFAGLFAIRAGDLLGQLAPGDGRATLSGLLIGADVALALREHAMPATPIMLIGQPGPGPLYDAALARAGADVARVDAASASRLGLLAAALEIWRN